MYAKLKLYMNTNFNTVDIPKSQDILENDTGIRRMEIDEWYYVREDLDKPSIDINVPYADCEDVDYVCITTYRTADTSTIGRKRYYYCVPHAIAQNCTRLSLDLDALLTMGGVGTLNYTSGWQERGHISKAEDKLFDNTYAENWQPTRPLESTSVYMIIPTSSPNDHDMDIVVTNIDFQNLGDQSYEFEVTEGVNQGGDVVMDIPKVKVPSPADSTTFGVWDYAENRFATFKTPGTSAYDLSNAYVRRAMENLYSFGQLQLVNTYRIPKMYTNQTQPAANNKGLYTSVGGMHTESGISTLPFEYTIPNYTIKNKKCLDTYRSYVIVNLASGDMSIKTPHDIYNNEAQTLPRYPTVRIWSDPTATGKPYARFSFIKANPLQWSDTVKGLQWANVQLCLEGASGSMWNSINAAFTSQNLARQQQQLNITNQYAQEQYEMGLSAGSLQNQFDQYKFERGQNLIAGRAQGQAVALGAGAVVSALGAYGGGAQAGSMMGSSISQGLQALAVGQEACTQLETNMINYAAQQAQYRANIDMNYSKNQERMANADIQQAAISQAVNENQLGLVRQNSVIAPYVSFTPEQNLGQYGYNVFAIYEVRKSDEDLKMEDAYYQRFGYNGIHRPLTTACFDKRDYFTYVQAFNVNISAANTTGEVFGMRIRQKAIAQLNAGVRVWKCRPDTQYYDLN